MGEQSLEHSRKRVYDKEHRGKQSLEESGQRIYNKEHIDLR